MGPFGAIEPSQGAARPPTPVEIDGSVIGETVLS